MSDTLLKSQTAENLSDTVLETVAARENVKPTELAPPLYEVIDPDALDNLFTPTRNGRARASGEVRFTYCGYEVRVASTGDVRAVPVEEQDPDVPV